MKHAFLIDALIIMLYYEACSQGGTCVSNTTQGRDHSVKEVTARRASSDLLLQGAVLSNMFRDLRVRKRKPGSVLMAKLLMQWKRSALVEHVRS